MDYSAPKKRKPNVNKVSKPKPAPKKGKKPKKSDADKLQEASEHHSRKHMAMMRKLMKEGMSFSAAHRRATTKVGK